MRKDKVRAYELRRQSRSYSEISKALSIPKSTVASWFKNEEWSKKIRDDLGARQSLAYPNKLAAIIKSNKDRWAKWHRECQEKAILEFSNLKDNLLFVSGIMLYWGEGDKVLNNCVVRLSNSDPNMIRLFYLFLLGPLAIPREKIHTRLLLYSDLIDNMQKKFWSLSTGIPIGNFKKSTYIKGKHRTKRLSYGVCTILVQSRELKEKILKWQELCFEAHNSKNSYLAL